MRAEHVPATDEVVLRAQPCWQELIAGVSPFPLEAPPSRALRNARIAASSCPLNRTGMRNLRLRAIAALGGALAVATAAADGPCRLAGGQALLAAGKTSEARLILEDCASGGSANPRAALLLGQSYLFGRDPDRAAVWLERATSLEPASSEIQYWLGRAYGEQALRAS